MWISFFCYIEKVNKLNNRDKFMSYPQKLFITCTIMCITSVRVNNYKIVNLKFQINKSFKDKDNCRISIKNIYISFKLVMGLCIPYNIL